MEPRGGDAQRKRRGTPAPTARRRRRKPAGAAALLLLAPPPSGPEDVGAPTTSRMTARRRRGTPAPTARRRRRKPAGAAALLPLAPPPSGPEDAGAPTTSRMRRRKPTGTGAAASPSSAPPPPSLRSGPGDGDSTRKRAGSPLPRRRKRGRTTVAEGNSGSGGGGGGGGHPTGGSPDAPAAPTASLAPPPSGPQDRGAPTSRLRRKRKPTGNGAAEPSSPPPGPPPPEDVPAPARRTVAEGNSGSGGGGGGGGHPTGGSPDAPAAPTASLAPPPSGPQDRGAPTSRLRRKRKPTGNGAAEPSSPPPGPPPPEDVPAPARRTVAEGNSGSGGGGGGGGHPTGGSPDAPAAPTASLAPPPSGPQDRGAPTSRLRRKRKPTGNGAAGPSSPPPGPPPPEDVPAPARISVAHTPNVPDRFQALLKNITYLIPHHESKGKSYECISSRVKHFLNWSKSEVGLVFEWSEDKNEATCWMHDLVKKKHFQFTVNAAFSHEVDTVNVEQAAVAFSSNFIGGDEYWSDLKDMLLNVFGPFDGEGLKQYDYLYVFTRIESSFCFRKFKIISLPKADDPFSGLVLTEMNTMFCLKVVNDQGTPNSSNIGPQPPNDETPRKLRLCPVTLYSISNGQTGFAVSHEVVFTEKSYSVLLENGSYVSSLQELEGYNISLAEIVVLEPLLKVKQIIGSVTNKTYCFARQRCKSILQSLFAEFAKLLESRKCMSETAFLFMHHVLVKGTNVRLYGVKLRDYTEEYAERTVSEVVALVKNCFTDGMMPLDLHRFLKDLEGNPLDEIRVAEDECSLLGAEDRFSLLIKINSEYMTNVKDPDTDENDHQINSITFFDECPYAEDWKKIMTDNEYMVQTCNVEESSNQGNESDELKNLAVLHRMKKKAKMSQNTLSHQICTEKKRQVGNPGMLQLNSKRNFYMHMPEKARKDGIFPFRLGMADNIFTAYFPLYLRFIQRRMRKVIEESGKFKKRRRSRYVVRDQGH